jgi:hypothetical protein
VSVWGVLRALAVLWLLRQGLRLLRALIVAVVLAVLWPVTVTAAIAVFAAWLRGWPPARLYRAAARSTLMTGVYLIAVALQRHGWRAVALAPVWDWRAASRLLEHAGILHAALVTAPVAVPAGLAAGGLAWAGRVNAITAGVAGRSAYAPAVFDARQWRRQVRAARGTLAAPGTVPLVTSAGSVPAGPVIRAVGRRWTPVLAVPAAPVWSDRRPQSCDRLYRYESAAIMVEGGLLGVRAFVAPLAGPRANRRAVINFVDGVDRTP